MKYQTEIELLRSIYNDTANLISEEHAEACRVFFSEPKQPCVESPAEINAKRFGYLEMVANSWGPVDAETLENESPLFIMWKGSATLLSVIDAELVKRHMLEASV